MEKPIKLTASIVLFNEDPEVLHQTIECFLNIENFQTKLYLINNSNNNYFHSHLIDNKIEYLESKKNLGFGKGHNKVLDRITSNSDFHLVLNPDITFSKDVVGELIKELDKDDQMSLIAPKVLFPDGRFQYSCRRYPKLSEMFFRRVPLFKNLSKSILDKGIYSDKNLDEPFYAEYLTGCFHLYKTKDFLALGGFDDRYFLYMEDVDICRKIDNYDKKKLYYPKVEIFHVLKQGSNENFGLFLRHTISMFRYFNKWGF